MQQYHSILRRPVNANPSQHNATTADAQYEREQAKLRSKQEKYNQYNDMMRRSHQPTAEDKAYNHEELVQNIDHSAAERAYRKRAEEAERVDDPSSHVSAEGFASYPLPGPETKVLEEAAKREYQRSIMLENQRMAQEKAVRKRMELEAERTADAAANSSDWFRSARHNEYR